MPFLYAQHLCIVDNEHLEEFLKLIGDNVAFLKYIQMRTFYVVEIRRLVQGGAEWDIGAMDDPNSNDDDLMFAMLARATYLPTPEIGQILSGL